MKRGFISSGLIVILMVFALGACGGGSSSGGGGGGGAETSESDSVAAVINTAVANMIDTLQDDNPAAQIVAGASKTAINPLNCTWYDQDDNPIAADISNITIVARWVCDSSESCTNTGGVETVTITNTEGTPFFAGTPFEDGIVVVNTYEDCTVDTICGPSNLEGTLTITGTGFTSNPCSATITIVSNNMMVDGTTAATVNMTMNITAAGSCDTVGTLTCDDVLSEVSTMTVGGTTYNSTQICDMIDNPTCP